MNNPDLRSKLKGVPVPERTEEYWNEFPLRVRRRLKRPSAPAELDENWLTQFAWKFAVCAIGIVLGLLIFNQPLIAASTAISQKEKAVRQQLAELPHHLRILMADGHGMYYLVADQE